MKKIIFILITFFVIACSPVDSLKPFDQHQAALLLNEGHVPQLTKQGISLTFPNKQRWEKIDVSELNQGWPVILIPAGETSTDWSERISTEIIPYSITNKNLSQVSNDALQAINQQCKQVSVELQQQLANAIMFQVNIVGCDNHIDGTVVKKIFAGKDAFYMVVYTAKLNLVSTKQINLMTNVLRKSDLVARKLS